MQILVGIVLLLPFHAFFTTWIASFTGHLLLVRAWKEILLGIVCLLVAAQCFRDPKLLQWLIRQRINQFILAFFGLHLLLWVLFQPEFLAALQGVLINTRYLAIFICAQAVVFYKHQFEYKTLSKIILVPAAVVVLFGLLQVTLLPNDFLGYFGYGEGTIQPYHTIDQQEDLMRINSTLRGPNPLGAYLIVPTMFFLALFATKKSRKENRLHLLWLLPGLVTLFHSHSRSAWIGLGFSVLAFLYLSLKEKWRMPLLALAASLSVITAGTLYVFRHNHVVENVVFHNDSATTDPSSSNNERLITIRRGLSSIRENPLGQGPGSVGPASVRSQKGASITENYYIQIAEETGLLGAVLFMGILGMISVNLYHDRSKLLSKVLLAALIGLSVGNVFWPLWSDEPVSLIWWFLAGTAYSSNEALQKKVKA